MLSIFVIFCFSFVKEFTDCGIVKLWIVIVFFFMWY